MYKLVVFVPVENVEAVKSALFAAGAGRYENYDSCSWETAGTGQFRPLEGSDPYIGSQGKVERVAELRVEMLCKDELVRSAVAALVEAHPYEEPAYEVYRIWTMGELPEGLPGGR
ncbi:MAG: NGG1p interacting factor NIF3 [Spirochaetales bacterium]